MTEPRRFPPPWRAVELRESFRIEDAHGIAVAYVCFADDEQRRSSTQRMPRNEARRIATNIAALPDLRKAVRDQD